MHLVSLKSPQLLVGLCQLALNIGRAEFASIYVRQEGGVKVLASSGLVLDALSEDWWVPLEPEQRPVVAVRDIAHDPLFAGHPARGLPGFKSVMMFPFRVPAGLGGLGLANLRDDQFEDFRSLCALSQISSLAALALSMPAGVPDITAQALTARTGLEESTPAIGHPQLEPAGSFLFSTLVKRPAVRSRNGVSFLVARTWRAAIKEHQLLALKAVKQDPPAGFVDAIGEELAGTVRSVHGDAAVRNVVPVPCGNSCRSDCLSARIADAVAAKLQARVVTALKAQTGRGPSHPRKSAKLKAYEVLRQPVDGTLIVDDVASSGRHLQLAVEALRVPGTPVLAVAWIGA